ncbi:FixH family protein [Solihabitans fulvus]|uniref:FixH family protein n=1 Tax=Solihabitans fulvus TaxID=1892852 RepID=A0A5B2XEQ1_9PSEU|nr:FixH family protein [Solihabitans fulvus]
MISCAAAAVAALVAWLAWPSGPAGPEVLSAASADYRVEVSVAVPRVGTTRVEVTVTDRAGRPAAPATVTVAPVMPAMGHAFTPVALTPAEPGRHRADVSLLMAGQWELTVAVAGPAGRQQVVLPLTVRG